jgi:RNA polymerase sigma-70 factor (ECF subfamily)
MSDIDDLVAAARAGEGWAFERLWIELAGPVSGYLRARGVHEVEDATSEVFLAAFKGIARFEGDGASFKSWLFTIAHRRGIDDFRRERRNSLIEARHSLSVLPGKSDIETAMIGDLELRRLLSELPKAQLEVIWLRFVADLSLEEVARITERSIDAVKQLQRRGVDRLRRHLNGPTYDQAIPSPVLLPIAKSR